MVQGRSLDLDYTEDFIEEQLFHHRGKITRVAKAIGCSIPALYDYIDVHNMKKIVDQARFSGEEELLDESVGILEKLTERIDENPGYALKAAELVLSRKGTLRKWSEKSLNEFPTEKVDKEDEELNKKVLEHYESKRQAD
jgi:hypothetical protein